MKKLNIPIRVIHESLLSKWLHKRKLRKEGAECLESYDGTHLPSDLWICCHCGANVAPKEIEDSMRRAYSRWHY